MTRPNFSLWWACAILSPMIKRIAIFLILALLTACESQPTVNLPATAIPFPTMTPGRAIGGALPTVVSLPLDGSVRANPATAVALAVRPTVTPDTAACPSLAAPDFPQQPLDPRDMTDAINAFLTAGGAPAALQVGLRDQWQALAESGLVRADLDLTGEGEPDILIAFHHPEVGGTLLVLGCSNGRYVTHYEFINVDGPPQVDYVGDMNADNRPDILFSARRCVGGEDESRVCEQETRLISWQPLEGSFRSLLNGVIISDEAPSVSDIDDDRVLEIVVRMSNPGTAETGPLRTGVRIYDWNGTAFLSSITQLDPPGFRIQVIQQADLSSSRREYAAAANLYQLAIQDTSLRNWFNDDQSVLNSYALYRLLTIYAFTEDDRLLATYQGLLSNYPDPEEAPVYASMGLVFWDALQQTNNLRSACQLVQAIISQRPEALGLLNRYGNRGPTYTADDLCPF